MIHEHFTGQTLKPHIFYRNIIIKFNDYIRADSPDQKGDKGQVRSSTAGWLEGDTGATEKAPARHGREKGVNVNLLYKTNLLMSRYLKLSTYLADSHTFRLTRTEIVTNMWLYIRIIFVPFFFL